jgi:superfamily II DNA or RNA helicase
MLIRITSPTKAYIESSTPEEMDILTKALSYTNTAAQHDVKRYHGNFYAKNRNLKAWEDNLAILKSRVHCCLVFEEPDGRQYIRPGSITYLTDDTNLDIEVINEVVYPKIKSVAWAKPLPFKLYPYQETSWESLVRTRHGGVSLCTGSGKSAIILKLLREMGLDAVVVVPSVSIFNEILEKMELHLGKGYVGAYGNGKKRLGKKFTIAVSDSLVNLKEGTSAYDFFRKQKVFIADECHTLPSETLEQVCNGVLSETPYRFFLSGTQTRGDGALKLLQSITGPIVHELSTQEAVSGGYICPHEFRIVEIESTNPSFHTQDVLEQKRAHLLRNRNIAKFVARLANAEASINKRQTLVLVEQLDQIAMLLPLINVPVVIAHSEKRKDRLAELGLEKVDSKESIEKFNKAEAMVLIGSSAISVGVNLYPVHNCVNWVGGSSVIKTKQGAVGRSIRLGSANPWASNCSPKPKSVIWDFDVSGIFIMGQHLEDRIECYKDSGSEIKRIRLK